MFYLLLAVKTPAIHAGSGTLAAGIISFRSLRDEFLPLILPGNDQQAALQEFETGLKNTLSDILDTSLPFTQTELKEHYTLCPLKTICHKTEEKKGW